MKGGCLQHPPFIIFCGTPPNTNGFSAKGFVAIDPRRPVEVCPPAVRILVGSRKASLAIVATYPIDHADGARAGRSRALPIVYPLRTIDAMKVRPFQPGDPVQGLHGPAREGDRWSRTLVAERDGDLVGRGTVMLSNTHPEYWIEIAVDPGSRRQGIGRALCSELVRLRHRPYPLVARAMSSRPERLAFARAVGFSVLVTCPCPQVAPSEPSVGSSGRPFPTECV